MTRIDITLPDEKLEALREELGLPDAPNAKVIHAALELREPGGWRTNTTLKHRLIVMLVRENINNTQSPLYNSVVAALGEIGIETNFYQVAKVWERHGKK
jgi:hypothetical protein